MIADDEVEEAVEYLRRNAIKAAQSKAERIYMEEYRKTVKASIMRESLSDPLGSQESRAYSDDRYRQHLIAMRDAVKQDEYHRWMMVAAQAKIEAWRTQQANRRVESKIG